MIQFSSNLPAGWSFTVAVDGDQNGAWGIGSDQPSLYKSPDFKIGQDTHNGIFCVQYVFTALKSDLNQIFGSSDCEGFQTGGSVVIGQMTDKHSATITYRMPTSVMFGQDKTIKLQICVWDTQREKCYFSPKKPYIIRR